MNGRRTLFLVTVLGAIVGFYYWKAAGTGFLRPPPVSLAGVSGGTRPALELTAGDELTGIRLSGTSGQTTLERAAGGSWRLTSPFAYPAEPLVAQGLADLLRLTMRGREISMNGVPSDELGFGEPRFSVCVKSVRRPAERCLAVGSEGAVGKGFYARWEDEDVFFLVSSDFCRALDRSAYSLSKKQIFTFREDNLKTIHCRFPDQSIEIHREATGWALLKSGEAAVGSSAIDALLEGFGGLYVKDFLDPEKGGDEDLGLKPPLRFVELGFSDGSKQTLYWGREAPGRAGHYSRVEGEDVLLLVSLEKLAAIENAFRSLLGVIN